jgi:hypothetical protein
MNNISLTFFSEHLLVVIHASVPDIDNVLTAGAPDAQLYYQSACGP